MKSELKSKIRNRKFVSGGWVSYADPGIAETFAMAGFDFVCIDMEHTTISHSEARSIITACQSAGSACFPRPVSHSNDHIKPLLEAGADGMLFPMVNSGQELEGLIKNFYYAPQGNRSFGVNRAHRYGLSFDQYINEWNGNGVLVPQIESIEGVNSIDEIVNNPLVDAVMVGPYDLSGSVGTPGDLNSKAVLDACEKVILACERAGKGCCTQIQNPTSEAISKSLSSGYTFVILGSDLFIISDWSSRTAEIIKVHRN